MFLDANSVARVYLLQAHVHADHAEEIASRRPAVAAKRKQAQPHDGYINIEFRLLTLLTANLNHHLRRIYIRVGVRS